MLEIFCFILDLYFLFVLIKPELGNYRRLIGIWRLFLYPWLLSISSMPLSPSLVVVPGLLFLFRVYQFESLKEHRQHTLRPLIFLKHEVDGSIVEPALPWFDQDFGLIFYSVQFSTHSQHIIFHNIDFVIIGVVLRNW